MIYDQLQDAEDGVNTYQSRLLTGIVGLEYQTAHNTAIKSIYEENQLEVDSIILEQKAMLDRLEYLQQ